MSERLSEVDHAVVIGITQAGWKGPRADSMLVMVWVDLVECRPAVQLKRDDYVR